MEVGRDVHNYWGLKARLVGGSLFGGVVSGDVPGREFWTWAWVKMRLNHQDMGKNPHSWSFGRGIWINPHFQVPGPKKQVGMGQN